MRCCLDGRDRLRGEGEDRSTGSTPRPIRHRFSTSSWREPARGHGQCGSRPVPQADPHYAKPVTRNDDKKLFNQIQRLFEVRNAAAHSGKSPTLVEARQLIRAARAASAGSTVPSRPDRRVREWGLQARVAGQADAIPHVGAPALGSAGYAPRSAGLAVSERPEAVEDNSAGS